MHEPPMAAGITPAGEGIEGIAWSILGQTYRPAHRTASSMSWRATFPPGTFVPPHVHPTQDEFLYVLAGELTFELEGETTTARPGDLARLPRGHAHGIFNRSTGTAEALFWVSPTGRLWDLFAAIDALDPQIPEAVVALAATHEVEFLPPPG